MRLTLAFIGICLISIQMQSAVAEDVSEPQVGPGEGRAKTGARLVDSAFPKGYVGWRGDGSGHFPEATPPLHWQRISATMKALRNSAQKLPEAEFVRGKTMELGTIREWLILGPVPADPDIKVKDLVDKEQIGGEAQLQPEEGDRVGNAFWRKVEPNGSLLFFNKHSDGLKDQVVYACTYLYSPQACRVLLHCGMGPGTVWVNGKVLFSQPKTDKRNVFQKADLKAGRNTLLLKTFCARKNTDYGGTMSGDAYFKLTLYGAGKGGETYNSKSILWIAHPPQARRFSCFQPIVVGDRVFVASDPNFLVCYDKITGKQLWMRDTTAYDFVTDEERKANPELFAQVDPLQKRFRELACAYEGTAEERGELTTLIHQIRKLLKEVNAAKYHYDLRQEPGNAAQPVSDGKFVYVWYYNSIAACFDLNGNRIWKAYEYREGPQGRHGYYNSPILIGDAFAVEARDNIIGFDRKTGKVNWRIPYKFNTYSSYHQDVTEKSDETDITSFRDLGLYKPGLGFAAWSSCTRAGNSLYGAGNHLGRLIRHEMTGGGDAALEIKLAASRHERDAGKVLTPGTNWSPAAGSARFLVHEGLLYGMGYGGVLRVYDAKTLETIYERQLDFAPVTYGYPYPAGAGVCASPTLAGKYIYLWGANGTTIIVEPGREFKQVAANRIESALEGVYTQWGYRFAADRYYPEVTVSSPVFDGNRIYYRAEEYVYCIGTP